MWIYLSPHFDDAVYSCGGLIWQQVQAGQEVHIWTICAGDIPAGPLTPFAEELHARWGTGLASVDQRRKEDRAACRILGAAWRHFTLPDCIYRRLPGPEALPVVTCDEDLWLPVSAGESQRVDEVAAWLGEGLQGKARAHLVSPLGVGSHVDHRLVRAAAESLGRRLWYYADYPYAAKYGFEPRRWLGKGYRVYSRPLPAEAIHAWQDATAAYASQLSSFWPGVDEMRQAIEAYAGSRPSHTLFHAFPGLGATT